jgi:hypothetical protein
MARRLAKEFKLVATVRRLLAGASLAKVARACTLRCCFDVGGGFPYYRRTENETPPIVDLDKDTDRTCTTVFEFLHSFTRNSLCLMPETLLRWCGLRNPCQLRFLLLRGSDENLPPPKV